jgi:hypothetical protein
LYDFLCFLCYQAFVVSLHSIIMGGALKFLSLATALLSPLVQSLNVPDAQKVPGAYIVEFAEGSVSLRGEENSSSEC